VMRRLLPLILALMCGVLLSEEVVYVDSYFPELANITKSDRIDDGTDEWMSKSQRFIKETKIKSDMHSFIVAYFMQKVNDRKMTYTKKEFLDIFSDGAVAKLQIIKDTVRDKPQALLKEINLESAYSDNLKASIPILDRYFQIYIRHVSSGDFDELAKWEGVVKEGGLRAGEKSPEAIAAVLMYCQFLPAKTCENLCEKD